MNEPQRTKLGAMEELKKMREEVRPKVQLLGKDASEVIEDIEQLIKMIPVKLADVGEAAWKDVQQALAPLIEKLQKLAREPGLRPAPPAPPPPASVPVEDKPVEPAAAKA